MILDKIRQRHLTRRYRRLRTPINRSFKYEQSGTSKIELPSNIKFNIDIKKVAESARKRNLKGENLEGKFDLDRMRKKKRRQVYRRKRNVMESRLKAETGEFVLLNGKNYVGYYHILNDETVMTGARPMINRSQPLIPKDEWFDNKQTYLTLTKNINYEKLYGRKYRRRYRRSGGRVKSRRFGGGGY